PTGSPSKSGTCERSIAMMSRLLWRHLLGRWLREDLPCDHSPVGCFDGVELTRGVLRLHNGIRGRAPYALFPVLAADGIHVDHKVEILRAFESETPLKGRGFLDASRPLILGPLGKACAEHVERGRGEGANQVLHAGE